MERDDLADLGKELAKSVLEALDWDAKRQVLDDGEHIVRVRHVLDAIVACLKRKGIPCRQSDLIERELKVFAAELFVGRCRTARVADGEPNGPENEAGDREYFEKHYRSRKRR